MRIAFSLLALLVALPAPAKEKSPEELGQALVQRVQRYYRRAQDFSARFDQLYTYVAFQRTRESTGKVEVKRPGLLRWESDKPDKLVIVLDGKDYWQYSPEDNSVLHKAGFSSDQLSSAFTFLWGKGDLLQEFAARAVPRPEVAGLPAGDAVELVPRQPQPQVKKLVFIVGQTGQVLASLVTDSQDNLNRLVFHDAKLNGHLPDAHFKFEPPKGATVTDSE
jgi:outer membrane lipoprotein carrier protein